MGIRISPTVRRRRLAMELRRLRAETGIKAADVARELGCSPGKISQMETCRVSVTVPDAKAMLELYGVTGERRDTLVELARTARQPGWWLPYSDTMHPWLRRYIGLETESSGLLTYQAELVPGLLRTEDYQRALLARDVEPWSADEIAELVELHRGRQEILRGADAPTLRFVLSESVLRRGVGPPEIMLGQLNRLLDAGRRDNVSLQVLPFAAGANGALSGSFTVLEFPEAADQDVVYLEHLTGALYLEDDPEVQRYRSAFEHLTASALSRTRSAALIRQVTKEL